MRTELFTFTLSLAAVAISGCQTATPPSEDDAPRTNPIEAAPLVAAIAPAGDVLPASEQLQYTGVLRHWKGGAVTQAFAVPTLGARIESVGAQRRITIEGSEAVRGSVMTDAGGRIDRAEAKFPVATDLLEQLPPANTALHLGARWTSNPPPEAYVRANAAADRLTMTDAIYSTARAIWSVDGQTVMRLDTVAKHRISWVDESTLAVRSVEMGLSYAGVTDLVQTPGGGWRVLQLTRIVPSTEVAADATIAELRAGDHVEFTACGAESSRVDLRGLRRRGTTGVAELALCNL